MHTLWKIACISTIIVGSLAMSGCTTPSAPGTAAVPTGGLEGIISDTSTGDAVAGAQVTIAGQVGVLTVTTGPDGKYDVADLPAGAYLVSVQATGYYVNAAQVGVVANVTSSGNVALEPAVVAVVTATATATPAATLTPTGTPSPPPTVSPSVMPSPTSTPRPSSTPVSTRRASAGAQSTSARAAPKLIEPLDESEFSGSNRITFRWASASCCLAADEYYVVSIPHPLGVEEGWVKTTEWQAPDYVYLLVPESRLLTWSVSVRRHTGEYPNGQWKGPIVSLISETWRFWWYASGGGPSTSPLSAPVSPLAMPEP